MAGSAPAPRKRNLTAPGFSSSYSRATFEKRKVMSMSDSQSSEGGLPLIPDDLTLSQFMLDYQHSIQPGRGKIPCLVDDVSGRNIDLGMLKSQTERLANALYLEYTIGQDDTVMLLSPNHINYPVALWAVHKLGGIVTCSNPQFNAEEITYQLQIAKVTFMIVHSSVLDTALEAAHVVGLPLDRVVLLDQDTTSEFTEVQSVPDLIDIGGYKAKCYAETTLIRGEGKSKIALLCWSSGTTGKPKGVAISHYALIANIIQMAAHNQVDRAVGSKENMSYRPGDVALGVLPFYHNAGLIISLHLVIFCAMTLVVAPKYDFSAILGSILRNRVSHLFLVPPHAITFCKHPAVMKHNFNRVKYVMIGAAPVSREIQEQLYAIFPTAQVGQAYGLTETVCTLSMVGATQKRGPLGSGGRLLPGIRARVIRPDGSFAQHGEPGELIVRSPATALGYLDNVSATEETFKNGWVYTGDEAILTNDHEVFIFDRLKEFLKVRGFQVAPAELEGCILSHPDVSEACVVGSPDEYSGEVPMGFVVLTPTAAESVVRDPAMSNHLMESIIKHVESRKVSYKRLAGGVRIVDSIPRNGSGKIIRRILREQAKRRPNEPQRYVQAKL
ncbi:hypothetical protein HYPSUDRAFT_828333 [Hypholoma sublateritium FD-334 SS-4]|uniref:AMP-dependent synthetase/ligase domain-containing protein n=1 Tax=Hypholoma sublateritium (strain FD-334 SS-4) TaxID=945553 RepID=A0A0D2M9V5_HYPSF|nr:hypothetical protein HYPSUDRAFT_828333 [Hypholoma sublateritium FD-334 SS-4]